MKKSLLYIGIATIMASICISANAQTKPVFKTYYWGTPYEDIQKAEYREGTIGFGTITFSDVIADIPCEITYKLVAGKMNEIKIVFTNNHDITTTADGFYKDFEAVHQYLVEHYGDPMFSGPNWKSSDYVAKDQVDRAILDGKVSYIGKWETNTATIIHYLTAHDWKFEHLVTIK